MRARFFSVNAILREQIMNAPGAQTHPVAAGATTTQVVNGYRSPTFKSFGPREEGGYL